MQLQKSLLLTSLYFLGLKGDTLAAHAANAEAANKGDANTTDIPLSSRFSPIHHSMRAARNLPGLVMPLFSDPAFQESAIIHHSPLDMLHSRIEAAEKDCINKGGDPKTVKLIGKEVFLQYMYMKNSCDQLTRRSAREKCANMSLLMSPEAMSTAYASELYFGKLSGCDGKELAHQDLKFFAVIGPNTPLPTQLRMFELHDISFYLEEGHSPYNCYDGAIGEVSNGFSGHISDSSNAKLKLQQKGFTLPADDSSNQHCVQIWQNSNQQIVDHYTASINLGGTKLYTSKNGEEAHLLVPDLKVLNQMYSESVVVSELCRPLETPLAQTDNPPKKTPQRTDEL